MLHGGALGLGLLMEEGKQQLFKTNQRVMGERIALREGMGLYKKRVKELSRVMVLHTNSFFRFFVSPLILSCTKYCAGIRESFQYGKFPYQIRAIGGQRVTNDYKGNNDIVLPAVYAPEYLCIWASA